MMMRNQDEELLLVEDKKNLLEYSINNMIEHGCGNIYISRESEDVIYSMNRENSFGKNVDSSDLSYALIYTKAKKRDRIGPDVLQINSRLRVIPLLMIIGPTKDLTGIISQLNGAYRRLEKPQKFGEIIEKVRRIPMLWASIDPSH
jgi:hypothetical protein